MEATSALNLICVKAGRLFLSVSVIADRKIGKSAAPSGAGGEGPQKTIFYSGEKAQTKT